MSSIPIITKHNIRSFVGEQNFRKGQQQVRDGAIVHPEQQAMALKAYCYGSLPEPYRVQVTFDYALHRPMDTTVHRPDGG